MKPKCIASTDRAVVENENTAFNNFFKSTAWSSDGTSIISSSADNGIRTYIVPPDLLEESTQPHQLSAFSTIFSPEPVNAVGIPPYFDLQEPSTTHVLSSVRDHPIRLHNVLDQSLIASYPLINLMTEAYISPHSLAFAHGGARLIAGSENLISIFDVSRPGQGPVTSLPTCAKKTNTAMGSGMNLRGILSTLAVDESLAMLAAGTFTRQIGLYDSLGSGECVGVFSVEGNDADKSVGGRGITQLQWSSCGRYLYIAERKSDGMMYYDMRMTGQLLGWLEGRHAMTNQRLSFDLVDGDGSVNVYAGGTDGEIRQWRDPCRGEGAVQPFVQWHGHDDIVNSVATHPSCGVLATSSGQRHFEDGPIDNSLRLWTWTG